MLRTPRWRLTAFAALLALALAPAALAGEPTAEVRALAKEGVELYKAGKYDDAIDHLTRANEKFPAPQYLVYIARALEKKGRLLEARETYGRATTMPVPADAPESFVNAQTTAAAELSALLKTIPVVEIHLSGPPIEKVRVLLDGKAIPAAAIVPGASTLRLELDPGDHRVQAEADRYQATSASFTAAPRTGAEVVSVYLSLSQEAAPETSSPGGAPPRAPTAAISASGTAKAPPKDTGAPLRITGGLLLCLGAAGIAGGAIAGGVAWDRKDKLKTVCPEAGNCTSEGVAMASEGKTAATVSTVAFIAGGVVAAAGVVLWIAAPSPKAEKTATSLRLDARGLTLEGRF